MEQIKSTGTVPVPNPLFDKWLPRLSNSELRLLLVVVRCTLGWREGSDHGGWRYKRRDWLTNSQLMKRTGCSSAAISRAIQSLLDKRLIRVESAQGELLATPGARKRNLGRLYFALGAVDMWITFPPSDKGKLGTTTNNWDNKKNPSHWKSVPRRPGSRLTGPQRVSDLMDRPAGPR